MSSKAATVSQGNTPPAKGSGSPQQSLSTVDKLIVAALITCTIASVAVEKAEGQLSIKRKAFATVAANELKKPLTDKYTTKADIPDNVARAFRNHMRGSVWSNLQKATYNENKALGTKEAKAENNRLTARVVYHWNLILNEVYGKVAKNEKKVVENGDDGDDSEVACDAMEHGDESVEPNIGDKRVLEDESVEPNIGDKRVLEVILAGVKDGSLIAKETATGGVEFNPAKKTKANDEEEDDKNDAFYWLRKTFIIDMTDSDDV